MFRMENEVPTKLPLKWILLTFITLSKFSYDKVSYYELWNKALAQAKQMKAK